MSTNEAAQVTVFPTQPAAQVTVTGGLNGPQVVDIGGQPSLGVTVVGVQGPPGSGASANFFNFTQSSAASVWAVNHNLGRNPSVTVIDSAHAEVEAQIDYVDLNNLTITFASANAGTAYLI